MKNTGLAIFALVAGAAVGSIAGCGGEPSEPAGGVSASQAKERVTVYSGRNEKLIAPLIERYERERGVSVQVRYADTSELAAMLLEEGSRTPAHVFISQDAAALGALSDAGLFQPLPDDLLETVPARFRSGDGDWIGLSGRARSIVYDPRRIRPEDLPKSLEEVGDSRYRSRFGLAPTNGSFQAHMAVYHTVHGAEALETLLTRLAANDPVRYPKNSTIVEGVMSGEIDFGLVNHYYLWQAKKENPRASGENFFMPEGEASSFVNLAGAGMLKKSESAEDFIRYLLSAEAQEYFATETFEYPLLEGARPSVELQPLSEIRTPEVPLGRVSALLGETLSLIQRSGLIQ